MFLKVVKDVLVWLGKRTYDNPHIILVPWLPGRIKAVTLYPLIIGRQRDWTRCIEAHEMVHWNDIDEAVHSKVRQLTAVVAQFRVPVRGVWTLAILAWWYGSYLIEYARLEGRPVYEHSKEVAAYATQWTCESVERIIKH